MANFIVDFLFGPENEQPSYEKEGMSALTGLVKGLNKPIFEMTDEEYDAALKEKMAEVQFNRPITTYDGDYGVPSSESGARARDLAGLALDRGVPMYQPAGPDRTFTEQQYLDTFAQQPPTNKLFTPEEDALARQQFAQQMAMFKNQMAGLNKLYPNAPVNAMTRSPYDALVFGPANNPAPFSAGPSQGEIGYPSSRFQARRISR